MKGRSILSQHEIEKSAAAFRSRYAAHSIGPLNIEPIVEIDLKIRIIPVRGLCKHTRNKGWICNGGKIIVVDKQILKYQDEEYRQVLTHEVAHHELHSRFIPGDPFVSPAACKKFHASISTAELATIEWEAMEWMGRVLVPKGHLEAELKRAVTDWRELLGPILGGEPYYGEMLNDMVIGDVARRFGVLPSIVSRRMRTEHLAHILAVA